MQTKKTNVETTKRILCMKIWGLDEKNSYRDATQIHKTALRLNITMHQNS